MANRDLDALPERSMALARVFTRPLNRAVITGGVVTALLGATLTITGIGDRVDASFGAIVIAALSALIGVAIGIATVPPRVRRAFEAYSWLGHAERQQFRERTGGPVPGKVAAMVDWLATTPSTPTMRLPRIELLAFVGRFEEARAELALAAATDSAAEPEVAFELASLAQYIDWIEHGTTDVRAMREATERLPMNSLARLQAEVTLAIAAARPLAQEAGADWKPPLEAVRQQLGWAPWSATLRDTWWPIWVVYLFLGLLVSLAAGVLRSVL